MKFDKIDWNRAFFKTAYKEKRTLLQLLVHFKRIWVIHISLFWYYTAYNSPGIYKKSGARDATAAIKWSATALGGAVSLITMIFATLAEFTFIPTIWNNTSHLTRRLLFLLVTLGLTCGPTFYIGFVNDGSDGSSLPLILGIVQFFLAVIATLLFSILPSGRMFGDRVAGKSRKYLASQTFTASYATLTRNQRLGSIALWFIVFACKFVESYFYLTLSFKDPISVMTGVEVQPCSDRIFGSGLCSNHAAFTLAIMFIMDLSLFFLDTYLWYVIWNAVFSIARSFSLGLSIWTPWKAIFTRLPERIYAKILTLGDMEVKYKSKVLVFQVWNAVIISMYCEHLLSINYVQKLLCHQGDEMQGKFFPAGSEAARRISFFAQSLTTPTPGPLPVNAMPTFTVLTPHYSEKILLSLREIIREDHNTRVTRLEYLKQLHPMEWKAKEEQENAEFLLHAYPDLQIAYLDEKPSKKGGGKPRLLLALTGAHSEFVPETGRRRLKFRIELPGNSILGDGKADNYRYFLCVRDCLLAVVLARII
ncbi:1,3-beta-D-glucan synthase [Ceratobasidium sp. 428]|nr:1,3-beta-D-glucan synthase [Ceratobasidium sp. 428]